MSSKSLKGEVADAYLTNTKYVKSFIVYHNERTDLRDELEKYWVGQEKSNIGLGGPVSIDWSTRKIHIHQIDFSRRDIYWLNLDLGEGNRYNIFVEPDLSYCLNAFDGASSLLFDRIKDLIQDYIKYYLTSTDSQYIQKQQKWFREKPYQQIDGKTPEEAVEILKSLGW